MGLRNLSIIVIVLVLIGLGIVFINQNKAKKIQEVSTTNNIQATTSNMQITSSVFSNNQNIPPKYTCDGENVSPPLIISGVPANTKSLALIMDDPDAPAGTWVHWTLWNIDPKISGIGENSVPSGAIEGKTSFGDNKYGGPCPPSGTHHYYFKLYALDTTFSLSQNATKEDLEKEMTGHIIQKIELLGLYSRQ